MPTIAGTPVTGENRPEASVRRASSSSDSSRSAASALRSSCATELAPGMATTLGRRMTQASATWAGVAPWADATAHDAKPAQVALAWVIRRPNVVAIPGASSVEQLERNAEAADLELTDDEDARLTDASDRFSPVTGVPAMVGMARERLRR